MKYPISEKDRLIYKAARYKRRFDELIDQVSDMYSPCEFKDSEKYAYLILRFLSAVVSADYNIELEGCYEVAKHYYKKQLVDKYNRLCK